ncbi:ribosome small subunit-dependent GTPase A [Thiomicrospira cyclica]|uniref:Small ribosomal subunit biogenesis GTPase RsgA n=1 Tax=Thiomicrospira cyclica (strain DSM 14477 / JCM 11371 / ALM1) TaxID=717773 RepID=F6D9Y4_THICA|nr:ribosome small subunit-dependent GTPase A [Thiomicrospira cyclica]AEG31021.1 ribosome biogenesis GTPase RsgA [Thiomicrospira cyclica ALM1]
MSKRKLSLQQQRRMTKQRIKTAEQPIEGLSAGLVITNFGQRLLVEAEDGAIHNCAVRQHLGKLVAGDRVFWEADGESGRGIVSAVSPRYSELTRPGFRGQTRMVAANIDVIGIVAPIEPGVHPDMIDRYLVAAAQLDIPVALIINKIDLLQTDDAWDNLAEILLPYDEMGIDIITVSAHLADGLDDIEQFLNQKTSVFVGPSGAGKSSLINALIPDLAIRTSSLSSATGLGVHTTTNSILYHLRCGGDIIDSPGVRRFTPAPCDLSELESYYADFAPYLGQCRFDNCTHQHEPDCAIRQAVEEGDIAETRFNSFQGMRQAFTDPSKNSGGQKHRDKIK